MADNVAVTAGTGTTIAADEITDGTLGSVKVQYVKLMDGTLDGTSKATVSSGGALRSILHDGTNPITIKGASTAAAAADPALVVSISPNGEVADDAVDSGTGNKIAAVARNGLSPTTLVSASGDRIDLTGGMDRALFVRPNCGLEDLTAGVSGSITTTTSTSVIASGGAGIKNYITSIAVSNTSATQITLNIQDGSGGTTKWTLPVPASSGVIQNFPTPLGGFTAATAVFVACSAGVSSVIVSMCGFKSKI